MEVEQQEKLQENEVQIEQPLITEKIQEPKKTKRVICECGMSVLYTNVASHKKHREHQKRIANKITPHDEYIKKIAENEVENKKELTNEEKVNLINQRLEDFRIIYNLLDDILNNKI